MPILFSLKNLTLSFPGKNLFKQAHLVVNQGDKIGLLGLNGHGKSSLFTVIQGQTRPDTTIPAFSFDRSAQFSVFTVPQELPSSELPSNLYRLHFYRELEQRQKELSQI